MITLTPAAAEQVRAACARELLDGVVLDYVEAAPGDRRFVFMAPRPEPQPPGRTP